MLFPEYNLRDCDFCLRSYTGEQVPIQGVVTIPVQYESNPPHTLDLIVVKGGRAYPVGTGLVKQDQVKLAEHF
jgi:hypothetical protein